ncbi:MAG: HalOD1 output domain-containing protein [Haloarculaceae archaeon]
MSDDTDDGDDPGATDDPPGGTEPPTVRLDWGQSGQPSVTVVEAVAAATDRSTTDLPLLQQRLDPDALDVLVTAGQPSVTVSFRYAGTTVSVGGDGAVEVRVDGGPADGERDRGQ